MALDVSDAGTKLLRLEAIVATGLVVGAIGWDAWHRLGLWEALVWSSSSAGLGVVAALPPLGMILLFESRLSHCLPGLAHLRHKMTTVVVPLMGRISVIEGVVLAILAGVSEEMFFRGVLQPVVGIVLASVIFGLLHMVNLAYAVWAMVVGGYLGWLAQWHGNLWLPTVAHVVIDLVGLWYLCRVVAPRLERQARCVRDAQRGKKGRPDDSAT